MERLFDPERADGVDPSEYSFRLSIKLETGDERYAGTVNSGLWIGSGARKGAEGEYLVGMISSGRVLVANLRVVVYDAYRVI